MLAVCLLCVCLELKWVYRRQPLPPPRPHPVTPELPHFLAELRNHNHNHTNPPTRFNFTFSITDLICLKALRIQTLRLHILQA
jgi:hypothetical protein